ncbi:hypothetical protein [Streptomyces nanshensis]|uniref:hypothetical protein n=1 Tax=Streptomyces nanshensis TaxID=518642 RepID=UPI000D1A31EC|nr:hypothetical protein [Streptomyces nanshensis]
MSIPVPAADPGDDAIEPASPVPAEEAQAEQTADADSAEETETTEGSEDAAEKKPVAGRVVSTGGGGAELVPTRGNAPAVHDGDDVGFLSLGLRIFWIVKEAARLAAGMHKLQRRMESNATKARIAAEFCAAADVEEQFTAMIMEASAAHLRVARASGDLRDAADSMEFKGRNFSDAHEREYRGVYENVKVSRARQPKPGFNRVK